MIIKVSSKERERERERERESRVREKMEIVEKKFFFSFCHFCGRVL